MFPYTLFVIYLFFILTGAVFVFHQIISPYACTRAVMYTIPVWLIAALAAYLPDAKITTPVIGMIAVVMAVLLMLIGLADQLGELWLGRKRKAGKEHALIDSSQETASPTPTLVRAAGAVLAAPVNPSLEDLYKDRKVIRFCGKVGEYESSSFAASCIDAIQKGEKRILVQVSTFGGIVSWGWQMHEQLRLLASQPNVDVCVLVMGPCQSAGVSFITAVPVEKRWATMNSQFMIHPVTMIGGDGNKLDRVRLSPRERESIKLDNTRFVIDLLAERTAIDRAVLEMIILCDTEVYFTAQEALEVGVIGGII